jgi:anti-anti-sigma factor
VAAALKDPHYLADDDPLIRVDYEGATSVAVFGELDISTAGILRRHLTHALDQRPRCLIVDLAGVTFLAAAGLSVLTWARSTAQRQGTVLVLRGTERHCVALPLRVTGVWALFAETQKAGGHPEATPGFLPPPAG